MSTYDALVLIIAQSLLILLVGGLLGNLAFWAVDKIREKFQS